MSGEGRDGDNPYAKPEVDAEWKSAPSRSRFKSLLIWGAPTLICPIILVLLADAWPIAMLIIIIFLLAMANAAAEQQIGRNVPLGKIPPSKLGRSFLYIVFQIVWIPLFYMGLFWAVCAVVDF
jgi:hypothetical protein